MRTISSGIEDFIALRQSYGYKYKHAVPVLRQFGKFCAAKRCQRLTTATAMEWARGYEADSRSAASQRMRLLRDFATYWKMFDPKTEVPPRELVQKTPRRGHPYIYSAAELRKILAACNDFRAERGRTNPIRQETFHTMFGLMMSTGLRRAEAIDLMRHHVDLDRGTLLIEMTKFRKSRLIPLDKTVVERLRAYAKYRDSVISSPACENFFVMNRGQAVDGDSIYYAFVHASATAGIRSEPSGSGPRLHDLRHTYVVSVILHWLRQKRNIHELMPALSTYLGHAHPSDTYWYLTGVPELMRFGLHEGQR